MKVRTATRVHGPLSLLGRLREDALARASGYLLLTTIVTATLGFVYWVIAARAYPASQMGTAAVSVSVMTLASLLSGFGTTAAPVQRIPGRSPGREWNLTVTVSLGLSGMAGLAGGVLSWLVMTAIIPNPELRTPLYALALVGGVVLNNCSMVLDSLWVVERRSQVRLYSNSLLGVVKIPLLVLPMLYAAGAVGIQLGWTVGVAAAVVLSMVLLKIHKGYEPTRRGFWSEARAMRRSLTGNYLIDIGTSLPTYAVPAVVGAATTAASAAYFYSAWRVGTLFFVGTVTVTTALFAEGSRVPAEAIRKARRAMMVLVPMLMIATGLVALLAPAILEAFGPQYRRHGYLLLLFVIGATVPDALTAVFRTVLRLERRYAYAAAFMWGLAVAQVGLTVILVPKWGIIGAGAAWLFAESGGVVVAAADPLWTRYLWRRPRTLARRDDGRGE